MHKTFRTYLILFALGMVAGTMGGLFGIGGGALIVPALAFLLAFPQHRAHGTSLVSVTLLGLAGVGAYHKADNIDFSLAAAITAGAIIGAIFGGKAASKLGGNALRKVFSGFLVVVAVWMVYSGLTGWNPTNGEVVGMNSGLAALTIAGTGIATGFLSALLGIGGGMVMIPAMVILLGVPQKLAQGVSLAAIIPTAFVGTLLHRRMGNVDFRVGAMVGAGAIVGAQIGSAVANGLRSDTLTASFGIFLAVMSVLMALKKK